MDYKSIEEIKAAVDAGDFVGWQGQDYQVVKSSTGKYLIKSAWSDHCIALTWDDVTLEDFRFY